MAKIAVELERALAQREANGASGDPTARPLAEGDGWSVYDVVCTSGPQDRSFEERHSEVRIAIVTAGTFQYRGPWGRELMTPGSLLLGGAGQSFECGHEHAAGDRCISFGYAPDCFVKLAADAGARNVGLDFRLHRLPPLRALSPVVALASAGLAGSAPFRANSMWEELSVKLAALTVQVAGGLPPRASPAKLGAMARVTRTVRMIERLPDARLDLGSLAGEAGLSPYHFLRTFERLTGLTPHQYILRARLREAAMRLAAEPARVIDIALDCGFGDVSNFNRAFRTEFGVSPRLYRRQTAP